MKQVLIVGIFSLFTFNSFAQTDQQEHPFTLPQIGLSFYSPNGFKLIDSSSHSMNPRPGIQIWRKGLIFQKDSAAMIFSISTSTQKEIDWPNVHKKEAKHFYDQARIRDSETKFDSSSTTVTIDSKTFNRFSMSGKKNGKTTYAHMQLSAFINGYRVNIGYTCTDLEAVAEIEKSLTTIKFKE